MLFALLVLMTFLGSVAAFFLKKASSFKTVTELLSSYNLYIGASLYLSSAIINIVLLKHMNYSVVLPLTSITYVWTMIIAHFFLGEHIGVRKFIGLALIITGCICITV